MKFGPAILVLFAAYVVYLNGCNNRKYFKLKNSDDESPHGSIQESEDYEYVNEESLIDIALAQSSHASDGAMAVCLRHLRFGAGTGCLDGRDYTYYIVKNRTASMLCQRCIRPEWHSADTAFIRGTFDINDTELQQLAWDLWTADIHRAEPNKQFTVKWAAHVPKRSNNSYRTESTQFFTWVDNKLLYIPTYFKLWKLFQAYERDGGNDIELINTRTQDLFNEVTKTEPYKLLKKALAKHGCHVAKNDGLFKYTMQRLWIGRYHIPGHPKETSFLEHHFIGVNDTTKGTPTFWGLHNWWRIRFLETMSKLYYIGYIFNYYKILPNIRFRVDDLWKDGSAFLGTSPEFEISFISLAYFARPLKNVTFWLGDCTPTLITTKHYDRHGQKFLSSGFPGAFTPKGVECPDYIKKTMIN